MSESKDVRERIESCIQAQDHVQARVEINTFLKANEHAIEARIEASNYFRRLFELHKALDVLNADRSLSVIRTGSPPEVRLFIQYARIRNLMGGSRFALQLVDKLSASQIKDHYAALIPIWISNYQYEKALPWIEQEARAYDASYQKRLRALDRVDVYSGLGKYSEALHCIQTIEKDTNEPLLQGILHEMRGGILMALEETNEAHNEFKSAEKIFPKNSGSFDFAVIYKQYAAISIQKRRFQEAEDYLKRAWALLYRPGVKPEVWLDLLFYFGHIRFFKSRARPFPKEWAQILTYETPGDYFKTKISRLTEIPSVFEFSSQHRIVVDHANNCQYERSAASTKIKKARLRLNLSDEVVARLSLAHPMGIPLYRLYDLLWPEASIDEANQKLKFNDILRRARTHPARSKIIWHDGHVQLDPALNPKRISTVRWGFSGQVDGGVFLEQNVGKSFARADVEKFFKCSRTPAQEVIHSWVRLKKVEPLGAGKYRILI